MSITVKITCTTAVSNKGILWHFWQLRDPNPFCSVCGSYDPTDQCWCNCCGGLCHYMCRQLVHGNGQLGYFCDDCQKTD